MKKILYCLLILILTDLALSQTITEKDLFTLTYKGSIDVYNFVDDKNSGTYCYLYRIEDEGKTFIISNNSLSEKYDNVMISDIHFDSKGNYYAVTANYKSDYGIDNNFLVVNGKQELNYNYIEGYSAYVNKNEEFVFIFKEFDRYKIGFYTIGSGLRQSKDYDYVKAIFSNNFSNLTEGEGEAYSEENFYYDDNGERGFIGIDNGKAKLIFETKEIVTDYSDINESSLTKNNELSFIAKRGGRFFEKVGNEFIVSGNKEYDMFEIVTPSILFNNDNEPIYIAADSLVEYKYDYYVVIGNQKQDVYLDVNKTQKAPRFGYGISDLKIHNDGSITYAAMEEVIIPGEKKQAGEEVYDSYYSKSFFVKNGIAEELGYNLRSIEFDSSGAMLYSGIADLKKQEPSLYYKNGTNKTILNKKNFDEIYEYGYAPNKEIFYMGQNYENPKLNKKYENFLFIGDKLISQQEVIIFQSIGDDASVLKFDSKNNYAFVAEDIIDSTTFSNYVITNNGKLPFPKIVTEGGDRFSFISNLMYSKNDKLFYVGEIKVDTNYVKELFVDNISLRKVYNSIGEVNYDEIKNEISFYGSREKKIYYVTVQL